MRLLLILCGWLILFDQTSLAQSVSGQRLPLASAKDADAQTWLAPKMDAEFVDDNGRPVVPEQIRVPFQSKKKEGAKIWTGEAWVATTDVLPVIEALRHYTEFLETPSKQAADAYYRRAALYRHRGELTFALFDFNRSIQLQPGVALALAGRGALYRIEGSLEQAAKDLEAANRLRANDTETLVELGHLALDRGEISQALTTYESALRQSPISSVALRAIAAAYVKQGKVEEAIKRYDAAFASEPSSGILSERADAHYRVGHLEEARADIEKVLKVDAKDAAAWTLHALIHAKLGNDQSAESSCEKAVQCDEQNPIVRHNRGVLYLKLKRYPLAANDLQGALELDGDFVPSLLSAAWLFIGAKDQPQMLKPDVAIVLALHALELSQHKNSMAFTLLAAAYAARGSFDDAVRCQKDAIELAKNNNAPATELEQMQKHLALLVDKKAFTPELVLNYER